MNPILLSVHPNENITGDRVDDLDKAIASFGSQIQRISDNADQPADIMMRWQKNYVHIECKDTNQEEKKSNDLWGSKGGHLGEQLCKLIDAGQPAFIIVLGSLDDTLGEVPTLTTKKTKEGKKTHWSGKYEQESNKTSLRALSADCVGVNVPIFYLSKNRQLSFKWALSYAKNILQGGNVLQWCPRYKGSARKQKALVGNGIGDKNAKALLEHFGSLKRIANTNYEDLLKCPNIGPERAIAILDLFG